MEPGSRRPSGTGRYVRQQLATALVLLGLSAQPALAGSITGQSLDGMPPGTLADICGYNDFSFGTSAFSAGVYQVTWLGGFTAWRDSTTIGAGNETVFNPGAVAYGTSKTLTMSATWTLWATTPDLSYAESTGVQWAFNSTGADSWEWGLEDMAIGHADADYQDAFGLLTRIGDVVQDAFVQSPYEPLDEPPYNPPNNPPNTPPSDPPGIPNDPPGHLGDQAIVPVPEPGTIALVALGLGGLAIARRRIR